MTIDLTPALTGEQSFPLRAGEEMSLVVNFHYDLAQELVRIQVIDKKTGNDSHRVTSDGLIRAGTSARVPNDVIYKMIPPMIEEITVLNRLLGHAVVQPEAEE